MALALGLLVVVRMAVLAGTAVVFLAVAGAIGRGAVIAYGVAVVLLGLGLGAFRLVRRSRLGTPSTRRSQDAEPPAAGPRA